MAYVKSGELAAFRAPARTMCFSSEVVDSFCASATAGQIRAVSAMIEDERRVRERRKRRASCARCDSCRSSRLRATTSPRSRFPRATCSPTSWGSGSRTPPRTSCSTARRGGARPAWRQPSGSRACGRACACASSPPPSSRCRSSRRAGRARSSRRSRTSRRPAS